MTRAPLTSHTAPRELATTAEVCARYRLTPNVVREACRQGRIPFYRVGPLYRFDLDVLDDLFYREASTPLDGSLSVTRPGHPRQQRADPPPGAGPPEG